MKSPRNINGNIIDIMFDTGILPEYKFLDIIVSNFVTNLLYPYMESKV